MLLLAWLIFSAVLGSIVGAGIYSLTNPSLTIPMYDTTVVYPMLIGAIVGVRVGIACARWLSARPSKR